METRHDGSTTTVDLEGAWEQLGQHELLHLLALMRCYRDAGAPLGEDAWSFGLWVVYETWMTTN